MFTAGAFVPLLTAQSIITVPRTPGEPGCEVKTEVDSGPPTGPLAAPVNWPRTGPHVSRVMTVPYHGRGKLSRPAAARIALSTGEVQHSAPRSAGSHVLS